jgi:hypothetical protein
MMSVRQEQFRAFALDNLEYKTKEELFEKIYLAAFIDSYGRIGKTSVLEEEIRDRFITDFEKVNPLTKELIGDEILILTWERWINVSDNEKSRADISLSISGFEFIIECKRLKFADSKYIENGVQRFVDLKYAEKDTDAGMIGFVIGGDIEKIVERLKRKVKAFHYTVDSEYLLEKSCVDWKHSFQSRHDRVNDTRIHLYHLFFDFKP